MPGASGPVGGPAPRQPWCLLRFSWAPGTRPPRHCLIMLGVAAPHPGVPAGVSPAQPCRCPWSTPSPAQPCVLLTAAATVPALRLLPPSEASEASDACPAQQRLVCPITCPLRSEHPGSVPGSPQLEVSSWDRAFCLAPSSLLPPGERGRVSAQWHLSGQGVRGLWAPWRSSPPRTPPGVMMLALPCRAEG